MLQSPVNPNVCPKHPHWTYIQPETGVGFRHTCLNAMTGQIKRHRSAMKLDLSFGWVSRLLDAICQQNPHVQCSDNQQAEGYESPLIIAGREQWRRLHEKANETSGYGLESWFKDWLSATPNFSGCRCMENAIQILATLPPRFDDGFKEWAIAFHDAVNVKLNKPKWDGLS